MSDGILSGLRRDVEGDAEIGYDIALDDVREALLAELDRLAEPHEPKIRTSGVSAGYLAALADLRNWAGGDR